MRVLYCTDTYPPQVNGVSVVTALSVAGLQDRGWECGVITPRYPDGEGSVFTEQSSGREHFHKTIPSISVPGYADVRLAAPAYATVSAAIRRFRPHLVHSETEFMIGRLGQIAAHRAGIPAVSSYHTDFARYTTDYGIPWLYSTIWGYIVRFHRRSLRIYTPSAPSREDLIGAGIKNVEVWGRGVDTDIYTPSRRSEAMRTRLRLGDRFVFIHVGRLAAEKRVEDVVRAYALALPHLPPDSTRLVIAGAGPSEASVRAVAPEGTLFLGYLDRTRELPELYASADAFAFASLTETLGLVVLEAMASGLPVVAAPSGGVADHLRDNVNGLAYPARDLDAMAQAMVRVATTPDLHARLAREARATAERLSWHAELDRLDLSYREVLAAVGQLQNHEATSPTAAMPIPAAAAQPKTLSAPLLR